ncbi:MAG: TerB family tellurite resistance protein [Burkholderiales bacterium]|nr:MAG: TerB family tellurite resistance protein [Burkholderiales bacterium]
MFSSFKDFLSSLTGTGARPSPAEEAHSLQLATAVLLVEVMRADTDLGAQERHQVLQTLRAKFALADDELARLVELAEETARTAHDYHRFTASLNDHFTHAQKIRVVEHMWEIAYSDARLDENEHHVISKVAGLLHVTHGEYIAAKLHAKAGLGHP